MTVAVVNGQRLFALPRNPNAVMEAFNAKRFAAGQEALTIARDHFVECNSIAVAIYLDQIALKALGALMKGNDQRVMAV